MIRYNPNFPKQRVSNAEKNKPEWYENCIDYVIDAGVSCNDRNETETMLDILHNNIPQEFYKKTLNPYNSANEKYRRFPATMRNYDIMSDIVRRYVSEYYKGIHEFVATACNPEVALKRKAKLAQEIFEQAMVAFQQEVQKNLQQLQQQAQEQGTPMDQIDPQQAMPDPEQFIKDFNEKYIDDETKQAQDVLDFIRSATNDMLIYLSAFFNFAALGECYTYSDIRGETIFKENVPVTEAYPIPNSEFFVEDHDMFARKMMMSYNQIIDTFDEVLSKKDREFLERYYSITTPTSGNVQMLKYDQYFEYQTDSCGKFDKEERELFRKEPIALSDNNSNLFEVWHVVWRGEARRAIVTYVTPQGFTSTRIEEDKYELNPEAGDISISYTYEPQVYEGYRIGTRYTGVYPIKAKPIAYQRNGKLPYNGIMEVLPLMGKFSIIKLVTPFQIMRNIISYHREMVIAKNKMLVLLIPETLINSKSEDKIYKMAADGVLIVDDTEDTTGQKMQAIRMLNANLGDYITQLTNLIEAIKLEAREMVDMNAQRYGEIATSAAVSNTQEAIARSSMGSVIITSMFDEMRCRDYQRDLDFGKLAYIDGQVRAYKDDIQINRTLSLDVNTYINSDYAIYVKNDQKELDKIQQLRQWAFSAAQNGDLDMAIAAITGNNVTQIKDTVNKFMELKRQHEEQMKQADQMLEQEKLQNKLAEIAAKGEEDRKTEALKYQYELQLKYMDVDMSLLGESMNNTSATDAARQRLAETAEQNKQMAAQDKLNLERQKMQVDLYNAAADRQIKREDMENKLKIARENKNKYDRK